MKRTRTPENAFPYSFNAWLLQRVLQYDARAARFRLQTVYDDRAAREAHAGPRSPSSTRPPRTGGRHAPHTRSPTLRLSPEYGPDAPMPRRPAGPGSPIRTAGRTAREAHRRGGARAEARSPVRSRQGTGACTPPTSIEFPILA